MDMVDIILDAIRMVIEEIKGYFSLAKGYMDELGKMLKKDEE